MRNLQAINFTIAEGQASQGVSLYRTFKYHCYPESSASFSSAALYSGSSYLLCTEAAEVQNKQRMSYRLSDALKMNYIKDKKY